MEVREMAKGGPVQRILTYLFLAAAGGGRADTGLLPGHRPPGARPSKMAVLGILPKKPSTPGPNSLYFNARDFVFGHLAQKPGQERRERDAKVRIEPIHFNGGAYSKSCAVGQPRQTTTYIVTAKGASSQDTEKVTVAVQ